MPTYLEVHYREKDEAKALGAKWDGAVRKWFVPDGLDLALFNAWLPVSARQAPHPASEQTNEVIPFEAQGNQEVVVAKKGVTLSYLLAGVAQAISKAFKDGVWTMVEVLEAQTNKGHVYLELSERNAEGAVLAKAKAIIWAGTANKILPEFERATGASIAPGIKLLVRAKPVFKPQFGFSIEVDAIDPEYTLGDLEARKREIRTRLKQEGIFDANKKLPSPWDFNTVLVVAPQGAAGLGDFQAESNRLERFGICRFVYATSRFQGEGAPVEIRKAMLAALEDWKLTGQSVPDAVAIIRGGGAVNDLAWLNEYELAKAICTLKIPVLTGIGHERDNTILDEVANIRFDTPSKVAAGIEQVIKKRVEEAQGYFDLLTKIATRVAGNIAAKVDRDYTSIQSGALLHVEAARRVSSELINEVERQATKTVHEARHDASTLFGDVRHEAYQVLAEAKRDVPALFYEVRAEATNVVKTARTQIESRIEGIQDRAAIDIQRSRDSIQDSFDSVAVSAKRAIADAKNSSKALFLEIAGQGPEKTLGRGFAIVRDARGNPLTSALQADTGTEIGIQFRDGVVTAQVITKD